MSKPENLPAFPISREAEGWFNSGMTLRDYFAAQALGLAYATTLKPEPLAAYVYGIADAMLAERAKPSAPEVECAPGRDLDTVRACLQIVRSVIGTASSGPKQIEAEFNALVGGGLSL